MYEKMSRDTKYYNYSVMCKVIINKIILTINYN